MKYRKKPVVIEAITFDELVEHGKENVQSLVNGMPWSFSYKGHPITHENDECYLIPTLEGTMRFNRGDMLITGVNGEIYPCKPDIFEKTYTLVPEVSEELLESRLGPTVFEKLSAAHNELFPNNKHITPEEAKVLRDVNKRDKKSTYTHFESHHTECAWKNCPGDCFERYK